MIKLNDFILYTGRDIIHEQGVIIHQPTIGEISEILKEKDFFKIAQLLCMKNSESSEENYKTFLMLLLGWQNILDGESRLQTLRLLNLLFKGYELRLDKEVGDMMICKDDFVLNINGENFSDFQDIFKGIFAYDEIFKSGKNEEYNPGNDKQEK